MNHDIRTGQKPTEKLFILSFNNIIWCNLILIKILEKDLPRNFLG